MAGKINGAALASLAAGTILVYSGVTGKSVLRSVQAMIQGKSPTGLPNEKPISGVNGTGNPNAIADSSGTISGGSVTGTAIAQDAARYVGHKYIYGGAPGPDGSAGWDCSSFVNWVLGHDFGITSIPGGYNPTAHGATAADYLGWSGAKTVPRANAGAGDLCVWSTHIGIAINGSQMVSALNPNLGTAITGIEDGGPKGETLICRRLAG